MATLLIERNVDFNVCKEHAQMIAKQFPLTLIARAHNSKYGACCDAKDCQVVATHTSGFETAFGIEVPE